MRRDVQYNFDGEYTDQNFVYQLNIVHRGLGLAVPIRCKEHRVYQNANKYEVLENFGGCYFETEFADGLSRRENLLRANFVALNAGVYVLILQISEVSAVGKFFFFEIENGDDDLHEQVEHEHRLNEDHNHKVNHARWRGHRSRHLKNLRPLLGSECDCKPVFNVCDLEHC